MVTETKRSFKPFDEPEKAQLKNPFSEFLGQGPPPNNIGFPGDIYIDTTENSYALYAKDIDQTWIRWRAQPTKLIKHPSYANRYLWPSYHNVGWIKKSQITKLYENESTLLARIISSRNNNLRKRSMSKDSSAIDRANKKPRLSASPVDVRVSSQRAVSAAIESSNVVDSMARARLPSMSSGTFSNPTDGSLPHVPDPLSRAMGILSAKHVPSPLAVPPPPASNQYQSWLSSLFTSFSQPTPPPTANPPTFTPMTMSFPSLPSFQDSLGTTVSTPSAGPQSNVSSSVPVAEPDPAIAALPSWTTLPSATTQDSDPESDQLAASLFDQWTEEEPPETPDPKRKVPPSQSTDMPSPEASSSSPSFYSRKDACPHEDILPPPKPAQTEPSAQMGAPPSPSDMLPPPKPAQIEASTQMGAPPSPSDMLPPPKPAQTEVSTQMGAPPFPSDMLPPPKPAQIEASTQTDAPPPPVRIDASTQTEVQNLVWQKLKVGDVDVNMALPDLVSKLVVELASLKEENLKLGIELVTERQLNVKLKLGLTTGADDRPSSDRVPNEPNNNAPNLQVSPVSTTTQWPVHNAGSMDTDDTAPVSGASEGQAPVTPASTAKQTAETLMDVSPPATPFKPPSAPQPLAPQVLPKTVPLPQSPVLSSSSRAPSPKSPPRHKPSSPWLPPGFRQPAVVGPAPYSPERHKAAQSAPGQAVSSPTVLVTTSSVVLPAEENVVDSMDVDSRTTQPEPPPEKGFVIVSNGRFHSTTTPAANSAGNREADEGASMDVDFAECVAPEPPAEQGFMLVSSGEHYSTSWYTARALKRREREPSPSQKESASQSHSPKESFTPTKPQPRAPSPTTQTPSSSTISHSSPEQDNAAPAAPNEHAASPSAQAAPSQTDEMATAPPTTGAEQPPTVSASAPSSADIEDPIPSNPSKDAVASSTRGGTPVSGVATAASEKAPSTISSSPQPSKSDDIDHAGPATSNTSPGQYGVPVDDQHMDRQPSPVRLLTTSVPSIVRIKPEPRDAGALPLHSLQQIHLQVIFSRNKRDGYQCRLCLVKPQNKNPMEEADKNTNSDPQKVCFAPTTPMHVLLSHCDEKHTVACSRFLKADMTTLQNLRDKFGPWR